MQRVFLLKFLDFLTVILLKLIKGYQQWARDRKQGIILIRNS